jgi:hypothetical protein
MTGKIKDRYEKAEAVELPAPLPLRRVTADAEPYPVNALGKVLGDATKAITDMVACPDAIAAQSVLAAAALAAQAHVDVVHPATNEPRPVSLYFVTIAASGERKSAADRLALRAIRLREADLHDQYESAQRVYMDARAAHERARELAIKAGKGNPKEIEGLLAALPLAPVPPLTPMLTAREPTLEGLHKLMAAGEPSMGLFSDEGGTFIGGHAMSDEAKLRTGAGLSDMWDGTTIKRVRGGDGAMVLRGRRLSLHLMAQPGIADGLLSDQTLSKQGLLSRVLVASPPSLAGTRMQKQLKPGTETALRRYESALLKLLKLKQPRVGLGNPELRPRALELSAEAKKSWAAFADECERALGDGGRFEPIRGFANKLAEQVLRIAAVLEMVDKADIASIGNSALQRAITIARFHAVEALRLFEQGSTSLEIRRAEKLLAWLHKQDEPIISLAQIYQFGPNSIRDAARAREAVAIVERHNWLRLTCPG